MTLDYTTICKALEKDGGEILEEKNLDYGFVATGSYALNKIITGDYLKGYPIGAIVELSGEAGTGKTAFISQAFVDAQKQGYYCIMIDNEHAYSKEFAAQLGVDNSKIIYAQPNTMEGCFEFADKAIKVIRENDKTTPIVIGFDSIGTAACKKELEDGYDVNQEMIGAIRAKAAGKCLRKFNTLLRKQKATMIIVNQLRSKVGVMYGDSTTTAGGGKALPFYASVRLRILVPPSGLLRDDKKNPIGVQGTVTCIKSRSTAPFQSCVFKFMYSSGIESGFGIVEDFSKRGAIEQKGGWYYYNDKSFRATDLQATLVDVVTNPSEDKVESGDIS